MDAKGTPVIFGILQRYVLGEILRAFALALTTMTVIFVLFMVMAEAGKIGLTPSDIAQLIPYVIPGTLPYTAPVSLLFAVTVVYGRLASDNEIIAVKTAGVSAMKMIWPAIIIGGALSLTLLQLSQAFIPHSNYNAKVSIYKNFEEMFYKILKKDREFNNSGFPFLIKVNDVQEKVMKKAIFKHRVKDPGNGSPFDLVVESDEATLRFDMDKGIATVFLVKAEISQMSKKEDSAIINNRTFDMEIPERNRAITEKKIQEWTSEELTKEQDKFRKKIASERRRQAFQASLFIASGRVDSVKWPEVQSAFVDYSFWNQRIHEYETEKQQRIAQSFGGLVFVLVGAPVGILFAKRDFLSAFMTCFLPIILVYYPLMLLGINLGKENLLNPVVALWAGNVILGVITFFVTPPILRH